MVLCKSAVNNTLSRSLGTNIIQMVLCKSAVNNTLSRSLGTNIIQIEISPYISKYLQIESLLTAPTIKIF